MTDLTDERLAEIRATAEAGRIVSTTSTLATLDALTSARERAKRAEASLVHVGQSLTDQAAARQDPAMPLLVEAVLERIERDAEAQYAMAETHEERVVAHGLSLLCEWQRQAIKAKLESES